jgi:hypothetical protein
MANATSNIPLTLDPVGGPGPFTFTLPVGASTHIYEGTLICQLTSGGGAVPYSTSSSEHAVGVAMHESDNSSGSVGDKRILVESNRMYAMPNGSAGDAFADTDKIGAPVYGTDDHTAAKTSSTNTRKPIGFFFGFEADGKVRVLINPLLARLYAALAGLTDTPASADALRDDIVSKVAL